MPMLSRMEKCDSMWRDLRRGLRFTLDTTFFNFCVVIYIEMAGRRPERVNTSLQGVCSVA